MLREARYGTNILRPRAFRIILVEDIDGNIKACSGNVEWF